MSHQQNITRIKAVHDALEELAEEVVFTGCNLTIRYF
jgi:hypothetical protein